MVNQEKIAIIEGENKWNFNQLDESSRQICYGILQLNYEVKGKCIAYMVDPGFDYVSVQKGIWLSGAIAVPLCLSHPLPSLQYVIEDTAAEIIIVSSQYKIILSDYCRDNKIHLFEVNQLSTASPLPLAELNNEDPAMIYGGMIGTISGVTAGLAAVDTKLVPYGALTATFYTGLGCLLCPSILYYLTSIVLK